MVIKELVELSFSVKSFIELILALAQEVNRYKHTDREIDRHTAFKQTHRRTKFESDGKVLL